MQRSRPESSPFTAERIKTVVSALLFLAGGLLLIGMDIGLPDAYWEHPRAGLAALPNGWSALEADLHPTACGQCHREQYDAWKNSLHAHAYSPGLAGQFPDMGHVEANDCLTCHAPLAEQRFHNDADMLNSLRLALKETSGAEDQEMRPLRHTGVSCAACHVRKLQRFGPPPRPSLSVGHHDGPAHDGFTASKAFEKSQFCAFCHQFPQSMAVNGKPLENTLAEWKASRFAREGVTCQACHMPDRRHEFKGIHDPDMVRKGLRIKTEKTVDGVGLKLTSAWIGHAFPSYVTPRVIIQAVALDGRGMNLRRWNWEVSRKVIYEDGWREIQDTRLLPGETRVFIPSPLPKQARAIRFRVIVEPDYFYKGVYRSLLKGSVAELGSRFISRAAKRAMSNDYLLYEKTLGLP
ncbi:MAG: hypothetical protein D6703_05785 [Zetaproteobacteria bacterium]|nr:MAG: hypothetical protein D6703_05785 [Zetaproteobacteria bacterium]